MPIMDGFQATQHIKKMQDQEQIDTSKRSLIVALTAYSQEGFKEKCLDAGMDEYMSKPINS